MKQIFLLSVIAELILVSFSYSQSANRTLSNLATPTQINTELLPDTSNTLSLGSSTLSWKNAYLRGDLFLDGSRFVSNYPGGPAINAFVGAASGKSITSGTYNTGIGHNTLLKTTIGSHNTAVGANALYYNVSGDSNTSLGRGALYRNTSGSLNTAAGSFALNANTYGELNAAYGSNALFSNISGYYNTATGANSLYSNTSGYYNTAQGFTALASNSTGSYNTATGNFTLRNNITGSYNAAYGSEALYNSTGSYNTGTGYQTLYYSRGSYNAAGGSYALNGNTTGSFNQGDGFAALYLNTSGSYNTGAGAYAAYSNVSGSGNTAVGYFADFGASSLTNATSLGYNAVATASNQVMLGNSSVVSVKAAGSVIIYSDGRFKKNIKQDVPGLGFINLLKPHTYNYDIHSLEKHITAGVRANKTIGDRPAVTPAVEAAMISKEKIKYTGFIAQEVEAAAKEAGYDFSGIYKPANDNDVYGLSYADFVVPLVKSVQELDATDKKLEAENIKLKEEIALLKEMVMDLKNGISNGTVSGSSSYLEQNVPNPAGMSTSLRYHVPSSTTSASLTITNIKGQLIKTIRLNNTNTGKVTLNSSAWAAGTYNYSLWVDGKQMDTKRLVIAR